MEKITILLVDDHSLFRRGLKSLLDDESIFEVVGESDNGIDGAKLAQELKPDVILLDLDMSPVNGYETLLTIIKNNPSQCVLILTVSESDEKLQMCLKSGASGYLLKNINIDFLIYSIKSALKGNKVLSPEMTTLLLDKINTTTVEAEANISLLTQRENAILELVAAGLSNKEIARKLNLTESTIKVHVQNILKKLNLHSRVQATVYFYNKHSS